jgi:hypothetical protein
MMIFGWVRMISTTTSPPKRRRSYVHTETLLDEREQHTVLIVVAAEERTDVTLRAEERAREPNVSVRCARIVAAGLVRGTSISRPLRKGDGSPTQKLPIDCVLNGAARQATVLKFLRELSNSSLLLSGRHRDNSRTPRKRAPKSAAAAGLRRPYVETTSLTVKAGVPERKQMFGRAAVLLLPSFDGQLSSHRNDNHGKRRSRDLMYALSGGYCESRAHRAGARSTCPRRRHAGPLQGRACRTTRVLMERR